MRYKCRISPVQLPSSACVDATWRDADSSERPSRFTSCMYPVSGNRIHKWARERSYQIKTNTVDLVVPSYWYINSF
jgi:hypothetical protein